MAGSFGRTKVLGQADDWRRPIMFSTMVVIPSLWIGIERPSPLNSMLPAHSSTPCVAAHLSLSLQLPKPENCARRTKRVRARRRLRRILKQLLWTRAPCTWIPLYHRVKNVCPRIKFTQGEARSTKPQGEARPVPKCPITTTTNHIITPTHLFPRKPSPFRNGSLGLLPPN